jgi:hypothetical protein
MRLRSKWLAFALVAPCISLARADPWIGTTAPPAAPPLHVDYLAPGNCPTEADFEDRVRARTPLAHFSNEDEAFSVHILVEPLGFTYRGHLSLVGRSGRVSERDVEDTSCSEVVDALALVTALAVDPNLTLLSVDASAPAVPVPLPSDAAAPEDTSPPRVPTNSLLSPPAPRVWVPREPEKTPASSARTWRVGLGGTFVTMAGIAPDALAGGGAFGEIESQARRWLAPTVRLTVFAAENGAFEARTASFLLVAGRVDACPVRLGLRDLSLRPCLAADLGTVRAEGIDAVSGGTGVAGSEIWFDLAAVVRARWSPFGGRFFVEAEGGVFVPFNQSSFVYTHVPAPIDTPWSVGVEGSLTLGVRVW